MLEAAVLSSSPCRSPSSRPSAAKLDRDLQRIRMEALGRGGLSGWRANRARLVG